MPRHTRDDFWIPITQVELDGVLLTCTAAFPDDLSYSTLAARSFAFFRRHADGKYSSQTLMKLVTITDRLAESRISERRGDTRFPFFSYLELPSSFDEETEVKTGGIISMVAVFPGEQNKTLIATHSNYRRKGLASALISSPINQNLTAWVARNNQEGQHFLISQGFYPSAMNATGAIRYSNGVNGNDD